jgi:hypothetical protein
MEGSRAIEDLYEFYRRPEFSIHGGQAMVRFLDLVADILHAKLLYFGTSHMRMGLSCEATWPERQDRPSVTVWADGQTYYLAYHETWQDGPLRRGREDRIVCTIEYARGALMELIARLKPADA